MMQKKYKNYFAFNYVTQWKKPYNGSLTHSDLPENNKKTSLSHKMSDKQDLMKHLNYAESIRDRIEREDDYALAVRFAETPEEIAHFEECAKKQAKELKAVEDKIASLKQSLAELSETETSKTEKK